MQVVGRVVKVKRQRNLVSFRSFLAGGGRMRPMTQRNISAAGSDLDLGGKAALLSWVQREHWLPTNSGLGSQSFYMVALSL